MMTPSPALGRLKSFCPALERSAHTAVGQVNITTCTVSTLSHSGLFRKPHKDAYQDLTKLKFQPRKYLCSFQKSSYKFCFGEFGRRSHQGSGQTQDGEEGTGRSESGVFADSGFFPHLDVSSSDVIRQRLRHHRLPVLTLGDVTPEGT